jgi:hypothetical protein
MEKNLNIMLRVIAITIYSLFLVWTIYNIVFFLVIKQRYKEFAILLYYVFFFSLFVARITQECFQFTYYNSI